jgi:hypothetical protein
MQLMNRGRLMLTMFVQLANNVFWRTWNWKMEHEKKNHGYSVIAVRYGIIIAVKILSENQTVKHMSVKVVVNISCKEFKHSNIIWKVWLLACFSLHHCSVDKHSNSISGRYGCLHAFHCFSVRHWLYYIMVACLLFIAFQYVIGYTTSWLNKNKLWGHHGCLLAFHCFSVRHWLYYVMVD